VVTFQRPGKRFPSRILRATGFPSIWAGWNVRFFSASIRGAYDRGEFITCTRSVPSPMTLAFAESLKGSALPKFPSSVSDGGMVSRLHWLAASLRPVELLALLYGSDQEFPPANGDFYSRASGESVAILVVGITTVATERFHRWDFHPLERQLASLHGLFHRLQHAGLARRSLVCRPLANRSLSACQRANSYKGNGVWAAIRLAEPGVDSLRRTGGALVLSVFSLGAAPPRRVARDSAKEGLAR